MFLKQKLKRLNVVFWGVEGGQLFADFRFLRGVLDIKTLEKRRLFLLTVKFDTELCSKIILLF